MSSQDSLEKQGVGAWPQILIPNHGHYDTVVPIQRYTKRTVAQDREASNKVTHM